MTKLTSDEVHLFFELMSQLQFYVSQKLELLPQVRSVEQYVEVDFEDMLEVREALCENLELIPAFVEENPAGLSEEHLQIVASWSRLVEDDFYIERILKRYAVFISTENKVYGVLGLDQSFEELIPASQLPLVTRALLLPFQGRIVSDGVLQAYNLNLGSGIKLDLKETYLAAKQAGLIVEDLEEPQKREPTQKKRPPKSWKTEVENLLKRSEKLRGGSDYPAIFAPGFALLRSTLEFVQEALEQPENIECQQEALQKVEKALGKAGRVLEREERARNNEA